MDFFWHSNGKLGSAEIVGELPRLELAEKGVEFVELEADFLTKVAYPQEQGGALVYLAS